MEPSGPEAAAEEPERTFWERQFEPSPAPLQLVFDVTVGLLAPLLFVVFFLKLYRLEDFGDFQDCIVILIPTLGFEMLIFAVWLTLGTRMRRRAGWFAGMLYLGATIAAFIGLLLLPFSIAWLVISPVSLLTSERSMCLPMFVMGLLGLVPFLTAFVYLRNGARALREAKESLAPSAVSTAVMIGVLLPLVIAVAPTAAICVKMRLAAAAVIAGDGRGLESAARTLKRWGWCCPGPLDSIVWAYAAKEDQTQKDRLAAAYEQITGGKIEDRLLRLD